MPAAARSPLPSITTYSSLPARRPRPYAAPMDLARPCWRDLGGRFLLIAGTLLVAFAAFQTWGTSILEWRSQQALAAQLDRSLGPEPATAAAGADDTTHTPATLGSEPYDPTSPAGPPPAAVTPPLLGSTTDSTAPDSTALDDPALDDPDLAGTALADPALDDPSVVIDAGAGAAAFGAAGNGEQTGQALGRIEIPAIGLSKAFLPGVGRDDLRQGPGHYPGTALPGHQGNVAIAGHRTTHGAPFIDIDRLQPGDEIVVETTEGRFRYQVEAHTGPDGAVSGHVIVDPSTVAVLADAGDNRLTLTACHPKFSARQRIVVTASLIGPALPDPTPAPTEGVNPAPGAGAGIGTSSAGSSPVGASGDTTDPSGGAALAAAAVPATASRTAPPKPGFSGIDPGDGSLGWQSSEIGPALVWATVALLVAHLGWIAGRLWRRPLAGYGLAGPLFLPVLFICFVHLDRAIPAF